MRKIGSLIACLMLVAACASETSPPDTTTSGAPDGPTASIVISGFSFGSQQTIQTGTTVTASNNDTVTHTWTSVDDLWDSGSLSGDKTFSFTFEDPGTFSFICRIHSSEMGGSIVVEG